MPVHFATLLHHQNQRLPLSHHPHLTPRNGSFVPDEAAVAPVTKTPPITRKRKLDLDTPTAASASSQDSSSAPPARKATKTKHKELELVEAALPATPQTLGSDKPMDSEDEVNSVVSSVDMGMDDDSSVDFGAGMCLLSLCVGGGRDY